MNAFGKPLGYSGTHIKRFESGRNVSDELISSICEIYGVDPGYFMGEVLVEDAVKKTTKVEVRELIGDRLKKARLEKNLILIC